MWHTVISEQIIHVFVITCVDRRSAHQGHYCWSSGPHIRRTMGGRLWLSLNNHYWPQTPVRMWTFPLFDFTTKNHTTSNDYTPHTGKWDDSAISVTAESFTLSCKRFIVRWLSSTRVTRHSQCNESWHSNLESQTLGNTVNRCIAEFPWHL